MSEYKFADDFLWGTATSGHQIEGNNTNSDWWVWETRDRKKDRKFLKRTKKSKYPLEPSGLACDSYRRYEEDFDLAKNMHNNCVRIGVEWSRLEPSKGKFNRKEFNHYIKVLEEAKERGLKTFVTLHHFTSPQWLAELGGWTSSRTPTLFARFARRCAEEFGELVDFYITINEPQVYSMVSYLDARWPPQKRNPFLVLSCQFTMRKAHKAAYEAIKKVDAAYQVGIVKNLIFNRVNPKSLNPIDYIATAVGNYLSSDFFLWPIRNHMDFIGVNFYFSSTFSYFKLTNKNDRVSDMGWWLEPKGLKNILCKLKKYKLPIYITENGCADEHDKHRTWYLKEILKYCAEAIEEGVDLRGYMHWSLLDNFEWAEGFWPRFGLVAIDREKNLKRIPRNSYHEYAKICKTGIIKK